MPRVFNRRMRDAPDDALYVGRPTIFGNPFIVGRDGQQGECVELFREWIMRDEQEELRTQARKLLANRDLVCWCTPFPCHADVLLKIANS